MRLIGILLALLLIAFLVNKQLRSVEADSPGQRLEGVVDPAAPKVPTSPADVDQFGKDMKKYLDEQAEKRAAAIREAEEG